MTQIVVSRRDGILRAPDGTRHRVARGKTLAEADHPAVLANPGDWSPMVVTLTHDERPAPVATVGGIVAGGGSHAEECQHENDVAELEETLAQRDAELTRLAEGLHTLGVRLPAEDDRRPGWLVDLALDALANAVASPPAPTGFDQAQPAGANPVAPLREGGVIAPPKPPRKRVAPPLTTRTGDDG
jgi:hypothetical protein